jgi:hypothetical protein
MQKYIQLNACTIETISIDKTTNVFTQIRAYGNSICWELNVYQVLWCGGGNYGAH